MLKTRRILGSPWKKIKGDKTKKTTLEVGLLENLSDELYPASFIERDLNQGTSTQFLIFPFPQKKSSRQLSISKIKKIIWEFYKYLSENWVATVVKIFNGILED